MQILEMFKNKWCWFTTAVAVIVSAYILKSNFTFGYFSWYVSINMLTFVILFSLSFSCTIRTIKLRVQEKIFDKKEGLKGIINFILYIIGISALQTCAFSGICGVNLALPLLSIVLPFWVSELLVEYSMWILLSVNILLLASLFTMKCFRSSKGKIDLSVKI